MRCAKCRHIFDATESLVEEEQASEVADDNIPTLQESAPYNAGDHTAPAHSNATSLFHPELLSSDETPETARHSGLLKRLVLFTLTVLAVAMLLLQAAYYFRSELVRWPQVAPYVTSLCEQAQPWCHIPEPRNLDAIQLESRHVVSHPNRDGALIISATFRNTARFAQAYPKLLVSMSNVRGQTVASRHFNPSEYINDLKAIERGMLPEDKASFSIEIADPGSDAVAFEIHFY
ncbi:conserved hypothetical protein [gamma proteobacterium HTCC5015]|nr:conserved hypothetical protein [gamma proteobacterium HTCC5015]